MYDYSNILSSVNLVVLDLLGPSVSTTSAEASKTITTMCLHVYYMSRQKIKKPPEVVRQQLPCVPGDQSEHQLPVWEREVHLFCPGGVQIRVSGETCSSSACEWHSLAKNLAIAHCATWNKHESHELTVSFLRHLKGGVSVLQYTVYV